MTTALLEGKSVIVAGASFGVGKQVARACLQHGASVYICSRDKEAIEAARAELAKEAGETRVLAMQADVSNPASAEALVKAASQAFPNLIGIVNNAGVQGPKDTLENIEWTDWMRTVEVNL